MTMEAFSGNGTQLKGKQQQRLSVFLWSIAFSLISVFLIRLRLNLSLLANDQLDGFLFFAPHFLAFIWGTTVGLSFKRSLRFPIFSLKNSIYAVIFSTLLFSTLLAVLTSRENHLVSNRPYITDLASHFIGFAILSVLWIIVPFSIGLLIGFLSRAISVKIENVR